MSSVQLTKDYAGDFAKAKSRDLVRQVAALHPMAKYMPHKMKVLFLPGVDAAEVYQVYDQLRIPRGNLVGVERERAVYEELQRQNLGIQLVHGTLENYVTSREFTDFDIVSLDFTGPFTFDERAAVSDILAKSRKDHVVLHVANLVRREGMSARSTYVRGATYSECGLLNCLPLFEDAQPGTCSKHFYDKLREADQRANRGEMTREERERYYTHSILSTVSDITSDEVRNLMKFAFRDKFDEQAGLLKRYLRRRGFTEGLDSDEEFFGEGLYSVFLQEVIMKRLFLDLERELPEVDRNGIISLYAALEIGSSKRKFFTPKKIANYSYISESGSPMIGCIVYFNHPGQACTLAKNVTKSLGFPEGLNIRNKEKTLFYIEQYFNAMKKLNESSPYNGTKDAEVREFLGSSAKPVLTKQRAIEEFRAGANVEDVRQKYRRINGKPLAAWKAHVTMGTYDLKPVVDTEELVVHEEDSDLERITEEDARDLIDSGIPIPEILESYPTSFSIHQLRAFEYWINRKNGNGEGDENV